MYTETVSPGADPGIMKGGGLVPCGAQRALLGGFWGMLPRNILNYAFNFLQSGSKIDVTLAAVDLCSRVDCA